MANLGEAHRYGLDGGSVPQPRTLSFLHLCPAVPMGPATVYSLSGRRPFHWGSIWHSVWVGTSNSAEVLTTSKA